MNDIDSALEEGVLCVSADLSLPLDAITQTIAILAKRGVGKTYTASVLTEEMLAAGGHMVVIDPVGVWWGLRASASGEPEGGLQILILGGSHADLPLDPAAGKAVADFIVSERISCVLDLSLLAQEEIAEFLTPFLDQLYQKNREPLHLIVDEADAVAPQSPAKHESGMLRAMDRLVRRGRAHGLGVTLITQRPAVLSKNVLTQIELLIVMRLTSPNDQKAIDAWIQAHGTDAQRDAVMSSLASLEIGEAWFWSPAWLGILERVRIRPRQTFDSSATPKVGQSLSAPRSLSSLDLGALKEQFQAALGAAADNDPEMLRKRIVELERSLKERPVEKVVERVVEIQEVPVLQDGEADRLEAAAADMTAMGKDLLAVAGEISALLQRHRGLSPAEQISPNKQISPTEPEEYSARNMADAEETRETFFPLTSDELETARYNMRRDEERTAENSNVADRPPKTKGEKTITAPQQRILDALAEFARVGLQRVPRSNVAVWAAQSPTSSGYGSHLKTLRDLDLIDYPAAGYIALTPAGRDRAKPLTSLLSNAELLAAWARRLPPPQARILKTLVGIYPKRIGRPELARATGQSETSSGYGSHLRALKALGLINYPSPGMVAATRLCVLETTAQK